MPGGKQVTPCVKEIIFSLKNNGYTNVQIAGIVSRHPNTISRIINANKRNIVRGKPGAVKRGLFGTNTDLLF